MKTPASWTDLVLNFPAADQRDIWYHLPEIEE